MDKQTSALLASWLGVALGALTLVVASIALAASTIALLSIDQVKRLACREFTLSCTFEAAGVNLVVVDAVRSKVPSSNPYLDDLDLEPWLHEDVTAWDLLVPLTGIGTTLSDGSPPKPVCLSASKILPVLEHETTRFQRADWGWTVNFSNPTVDLDSPNRPDGISPKRTIGFEFDATYAKLRRPVDITLRLKAFKGNLGTGFRNIIATSQEDYDIALPQGSLGVMMVCPLPRLAPGPYHLTLQSHGKEGDWEQTIDPIDLQITEAVPVTALPSSPPPKRP